MATQRTNITTSLKIKVENGTTNTGTVKYATRTFSSINPGDQRRGSARRRPGPRRPADARRRRRPARRERDDDHGLSP